LKIIQEKTGTTIIVPPQADASEHIIIEGDPNEVKAAIKEINSIIKPATDESEERKLFVKKNKHKVVIGKGRANIQRIYKMFRVTVIVPPQEDPDENIILRGSPTQIEAASFDILNTLQETGGNRDRPQNNRPRDNRDRVPRKDNYKRNKEEEEPTQPPTTPTKSEPRKINLNDQKDWPDFSGNK